MKIAVYSLPFITFSVLVPTATAVCEADHASFGGRCVTTMDNCGPGLSPEPSYSSSTYCACTCKLSPRDWIAQPPTGGSSLFDDDDDDDGFTGGSSSSFGSGGFTGGSSSSSFGSGGFTGGSSSGSLLTPQQQPSHLTFRGESLITCQSGLSKWVAACQRGDTCSDCCSGDSRGSCGPTIWSFQTVSARDVDADCCAASAVLGGGCIRDGMCHPNIWGRLAYTDGATW